MRILGSHVLFLILLVFAFHGCYSKEYRQERAVVKYYNPKYVSSPQALTVRAGRGKPYQSNVTAVILHVWNNNVTFKITYKLDGTDFTWKTKICDIVHFKWLAEYLKHYSNIPVQCPLFPGFYGFFNVELPPKNFPFPLPRGDTYLIIGYHLTETMEPLVEFSLIVHIK